MAGGAGNDSYYVNNLGDTVVENAGEGSEQVTSSVRFDLTGQYIERLTLTGSDDINGRATRSTTLSSATPAITFSTAGRARMC